MSVAAGQQPDRAMDALDYVIGPEDVLAIIIVDAPELSGKFGVNADGTFTFPFVGRVTAAGLSVGMVERALTERLMGDGFLENPQVTVSLDQAGSRQYFVWGEVRQPGRYPMRGDIGLIEALSRAGFTTPQAGGDILVQRASDPSSASTAPSAGTDVTEVVRIPLRDLEAGKGGGVLIRDGDTIFVSRVDTVFVFGEVRNPGAYPVTRSSTTVLQTLSLAGGATDRAALNRLIIDRVVNDERVEVKPELTDIVRPGDTIIVPQRFF